MKIVVFGSQGFLGAKSVEVLSRNHEVIQAGRSYEGEFKIDATKKEDIKKFLLKHRPEVVLDTIALSSSTQCENNPELAEQLNYITAKNIAEVCREIDCWVVFISSSYLFDGEKGNYSENDQTSPINQYARTKIMAEKEILKNPKSIILRIDVMYGYNGIGKKNGVFDQILSGNKITLRDPSQIRQPIFVEDVPNAMMELILKKQTGIFHLAGPNRVTMVDFLKNLETPFRKNSLINVSTELSQGSTLKIPKNATFDTSKAQSLGIKFTKLEDGLKIIEKELKS